MDAFVLGDVLTIWGLPALLALLLLTGVGVPIPEDLLLLTAGYLIFAGVLQWQFVTAVAFCGVVGSDTMLYAAGRWFGWRPAGTNAPSMRARLGRVARLFERMGAVTVFLARLVPGTRLVVFVSAGIGGMPLTRFLAYDVAGAAIWIPLLLVAGHAAGPHLGTLSSVVQRIQSGATVVLLAAIVLLVAWFFLGREQAKL